MTESPIEALKRGSHYLRGALAEETASAEPGFSKDSEQLLKPHGLYQQKDRDRKGQNPTPVLMLRGRIPGGRLSHAQYLAWDALADTYGDRSLRLTTRQSIELHGVIKGDIKATLQELHRAALTTQGACGDVVRNVTLAPNPWKRADINQLEAVAERISDHFLAKSRAYTEIWLDGTPVPLEQESEPFYGSTYLPRKFKIALTVVGENLVDIYTNDLAFAATFEEGRLAGFFVFAGGGLGRTHNDPTTFARLADLLGWIPAGALLPVAEAVVATQRDEGDRTDRKHARLKYLVARKGSDWFREEVQRRSGVAFQARALPAWHDTHVLGWLPAADGTWAYGVHTPAGRISGALKEILNYLVETHQLSVQISPDQDLILTNIPAGERTAVEAALRAGGATEADPLSRRALACVALPLCSLAITEAERVLPDFLALLRSALVKHHRLAQAPVFRITGCANGCARPYNAELALVGQGVGKYVVHAGGSAQGDRIAYELRQKVAVSELPELFDRLVGAWATEGAPEESFGDFAARLGPASLGQRLEVP